ncbi:MAG: epoxyqueuosine reductase QueH [Patescibacteria group bacterium]|jgi:predicted adenine nucleotide alpha hydrolase (AANH) superfamily ATPase/VanZ family protein
MLRLTKTLIAFAWFSLVLKLVTMSLPYYPEAIEQITLADKLVHFILFGALFYLLTDAVLKKDFSKWRWAVYPSLIFSVLFAFFTEYLQLYIPSRTSSLFDTSAGLAGIAFFGWLVRKRIRSASAAVEANTTNIKKSGVKPELNKPKLLLHICCIGCGAFVSQSLKDEFKITLFYYNPNIFPVEEYEKRLEETRRIAKKFRLPLLAGEYDHKKWLKKIKGLEKEPEKGKRCLVCYRDRLTMAARTAKEKGDDFFTSTLTVSPHKDAKAINAIGRKLEKKYKVKFYEADFKKNDGFKKSCALSRELDLYRQDYCGCEFSREKQPPKKGRVVSEKPLVKTSAGKTSGKIKPAKPLINNT